LSCAPLIQRRLLRFLLHHKNGINFLLRLGPIFNVCKKMLILFQGSVKISWILFACLLLWSFCYQVFLFVSYLFHFLLAFVKNLMNHHVSELECYQSNIFYIEYITLATVRWIVSCHKPRFTNDSAIPLPLPLTDH